MSLSAALAEGPSKIRKGPPCRLGLLVSLGGDDGQALAAMLDDPAWSGAEIARALDEHVGLHTAVQTVNRHRRRECSCEPR